jgi:hypothetical protein
MKKSFFIHSLGCPKNSVDSQSMAELLMKQGYRVAENQQEAGVIIVNTCPEDKRGRYNAFAGLSWGVPNIFSTFFAGLVMDNLNPDLVWIFAGCICLVTMCGYLILNPYAQKRLQPVIQE